MDKNKISEYEVKGLSVIHWNIKLKADSKEDAERIALIDLNNLIIDKDCTDCSFEEFSIPRHRVDRSSMVTIEIKGT